MKRNKNKSQIRVCTDRLSAILYIIKANLLIFQCCIKAYLGPKKKFGSGNPTLPNFSGET